ncbi:uncharacterized protein [Diadema antillarum]|uniref:uncharacterized protein n=1 Tax=Diadema antillarum TaxID=105358 RepID=UPI003A8A3C04
MDPEDLILVQWKRDGKENTVAVKDIICPDGPPHPGSTIIMEWKTSKKKTEIWEGTVLRVPEEKDEGEEEESMMVDSESSEEEDDNIPLARFSAQVPSSTRNDGNSSESSKENALQSEAPSSTANDQNSSKPSQEKTLQSRAPSSAANDQSSSKPSQEKTLQSEASSSTANDQDSSKPSPEKTLHSEAPASTENDGNSLDPSQEKTLQSEPIPVCGLSSTRVGEDIPRLSENGKARKKTADPTRWKQHMRKERRSHGLPYKARDGKQHQARCVGPPCGASCKVKCSTKISVDVREELFNSYWECGSYERQRDFICQHKDECKSCTRYDNATLEEREDLQEEHQQHLHNKQRARDEKERDKARAQALPDTVTHVTLYSDCCGGQNRNKFVSAALMYVVRTSHIKVIDQKYLESGHTQMECDSVHSAIERTKRKVAVYHPNQWSTVVTMSRQKKPYEVKQMSHEEFFDLKGLASEILPNTQRDVEGNKVQWMKLKHLRYEKASPLTIKFRYSFDDDFSELKVSASCRRMKVPKLEMLYKDMLKISSAKKSDLINLCDTLVIPRVYHSFYRDLPAHAAGSQVEDNESYVEHAVE